MERGTVIDVWAVTGRGMTAQTRATTTAVTVDDIRILRPRRWLATIVGLRGGGGGSERDSAKGSGIRVATSAAAAAMTTTAVTVMKEATRRRETGPVGCPTSLPVLFARSRRLWRHLKTSHPCSHPGRR